LFMIPVEFINAPFNDVFVEAAKAIFEKMLDLSLPFLVMAVTVSVLSNYLHVGPVFSPEPLVPNIKKIDPFSGFKKIFSIKNVVEFIKSIVKVLLLSSILFFVIKKNLGDIMLIPMCRVECIAAVMGDLMFDMALFSLFGFMIMALLDTFFQRYQHLKELKMTKDEVKREYKDTEGSPEIRSARRSFHREILEGGVENKVKRSSVVITNPTHIAVGLYYEQGETKLPQVTCKGKDFLALRMKDIAYQNDIPVVENVELARTLFEEVKENHYIPRKLIEPVAAVLRWLHNSSEKK
ncbi:MAG: EscU/YscU/HrcU family type III secretion system export apparatus switch protein, partial [Gammaproteobacteria bacterium]